MIVRKTINIYEPLTEEEKEQIKVLKEMRDEDIDYSDIPELTEEQLKKFRRVNPLRKPAVGTESV